MNVVPAVPAQSPSRWSIVLSILLMVFGVLAIGLPVLASIGFARLLAWLILFDGVVQLLHAFRSRGVGRIVWKILVAVLYVGVGIWLLMHTLIGLAGLTLVMVAFFFAEGILKLFAYVSARKSVGSGWILLSAAVTVLVAIMIWRHWPSSSLWAIGTLIGVSMLMTGTTSLMMALAVRRLVRNHGALGRPEPHAA
jgi:uncharacterized membrane protein HdeD (DUF308 family)